MDKEALVLKQLGRAVVLAALVGAIGYVFRWLLTRGVPAMDTGGPEGSWGLERSGLAGPADGTL
jgi:hypothetical protein